MRRIGPGGYSMNTVCRYGSPASPDFARFDPSTMSGVIRKASTRMTLATSPTRGLVTAASG